MIPLFYSKSAVFNVYLSRFALFYCTDETHSKKRELWLERYAFFILKECSYETLNIFCQKRIYEKIGFSEMK